MNSSTLERSRTVRFLAPRWLFAIGLSIAIALVWPGRSGAAVGLDEVQLCRVVQGDGVCWPQPLSVFTPESRLWARVALTGLDTATDSVDLRLRLSVVGPDGEIVHEETVIDGRRALPPGSQSIHAVVTYDVPQTAEHGDYRLRLELTDRQANLATTLDRPFTVGVKDQIAADLAVHVTRRSPAVAITAHGVLLANEIGGQAAPQGQLFLLVDTSWRNLLLEASYRADLEELVSVTVDRALTYPAVDLQRLLADALPQTLTIEPFRQFRGWLTFVVPADLTSAELHFRDDTVGQAQLTLPLFDRSEGDMVTVPSPGTGGPPVLPPGGASPAALQESEPNDSALDATLLPAGRQISVEGAFDSAADQDWYALRVETIEPSLWEVAVSDVADVDVGLEVWVESGERTLIDAAPAGSGERIHHLGLEPGVHRFAVSSRGGASGGERYTLTARLTGRVRVGEEAELNNRREAANHIEVSEPVSGWIAFPRDADFYELTVQEEATYALVLTAPEASDLTLTLRDESGRELGNYNLGEEGVTEQQSVQLLPGIYFLEVGGTPDPSRRYTLVVIPLRGEGLNQDLEDNDSAAQANPLTPGLQLAGSFRGLDEDWFVVENDTGDDQVLKALIWGSRSGELALYDAAGRRLDASRARATYVFARVPPGLSYVQARGANSSYKLSVWMDPPAPVEDPRLAAQLGLNTLVPAALDWQAEHRCFGCHVQAMSVMGASLGIDNGYELNQEAVAELLAFMRADRSQTGQDVLTAQLLTGVAQSFYEESVHPGDAELAADLASVAEVLVAAQQGDGRWSHSRVEPPVHEGDIQATADALRVLRSLGGDWEPQIDLGVAYLAAADPVTTQDFAYQIMGLVDQGDPTLEPAIVESMQAFLALQNEDGGWSEAADLGSSPYATGQALFALKLAGVSVGDPAFARGVSWLLRMQDFSGSWEPQEFSNAEARPSLFPPTMWATIGLAGTFQTIDVQITSPLPGEVAAGRVRIEADVEEPGPTPVDRVLFYVDGKLVCFDEFAPFACDWTAPEELEAHLLRVTATDTAGRTGEDRLLTALPVGVGTIRVEAVGDATLSAPTHVEIVLDASGSMNALLDGRPRIDIARSVLTDLLDSLPEAVDVALRAYGHQYHRDARVCSDTELLAPFGTDRREILDRVNQITPQGMTPIGGSLEQVAADLADVPGQAVVILISDGEETCGADACSVIRDLVAGGLKVQTHVVGYAIDDDLIAGQLACIAEASGGSYLPAGDAGQLAAALQQAVSAPFVVLTPDGEEVGRGVVGGDPITLQVGNYVVQVLGDDATASAEASVRAGRETLLTLSSSDGLD